MIRGNSSARGRCPASSRPARISARICGLPCITVVLLRSSACDPRTPSRLATTVVALLRELLLVIHEHHGVLAGLAGAGEFDGQVPRRNTIARREGHRLFDADAVQQRSVLAAQILHGPFAVAPDQRQMLARESDIVGITQLVRAGAAERDAVAIQGDGGGFTIQVADDQFAGSNCCVLAVKVLAYHSSTPLYSAFVLSALPTRLKVEAGLTIDSGRDLT